MLKVDGHQNPGLIGHHKNAKAKSGQHKAVKKTPENAVFQGFVAERVGFEPTCACAQTDFESAPL